MANRPKLTLNDVLLVAGAIATAAGAIFLIGSTSKDKLSVTGVAIALVCAIQTHAREKSS